VVASNIGDLAIGIQATKGTPATTANVKTPLTAGAMEPARETADLEESTGVRMRSGLFVVRARSAGTPAFYARPELAPVLLFGALGGKAVTGAGDPYTHTLNVAATQPWLTIWRNVGDLIFERFPDCKISQLVIRSTSGAPLTMEATIVGLMSEQAAAALATPTVISSVPFMHYDAEAALKVEGTAVASMRSVVVTISTGATPVDGDNLGGIDVAEGLVTVTYETQQIVTDRALWNRLHYGTAAPADMADHNRGIVTLAGSPAGLDLLWSKRDNTGAVAAPERSLRLSSTNVVIASITGITTTPGADPLVSTVTYRALGVGGGSGLTAIVKNGVTAYAAS
jgi:hypothetical protein